MAGDQYQVSDIDPILQQLTVVLDAHSVESLYHGTGQLGRGSRASSVCCVLGMDGVVLERKPSLLIATVRKRKLSVPTPGLFFWPGALKAHSGLLSPTPPPVSSDRVVVAPCDARREKSVEGLRWKDFMPGGPD